MDANQILKQAGEHFAKVLAESEMRQVHVPEWGVTFYYPRALPLFRRSRILKMKEEGGLEFLAQIVIECACDENGKRIFNASAHMDYFTKKVDSDVLGRVAGEMANAMVPEDDIVGKSETTPSSGDDTD